MSYGERRGYGGGSRYGGDRGFGGPKPVETGKEYDVQVTEISRQGDGIARVQGFVIFVKGGKPGQKAKVRITNVGSRFATGVIADGKIAQGQSEQTVQTGGSKDVAPAVSEQEKPELQDYQSKEEQEISPEKLPEK
jgi:predicted RNA-binding protein with TRAM domain